MQIIQSLLIGLAALRRNKLRSLLTMLGIIIGISAVVGMVSIGDGAKFLVLAEFERMGGSDLIICFRPNWIQREDGTWEQNKAPVYLEYEDIDAVMTACPSIKSITGEIDTMAQPISYKGETKHFRFEGVTPLYQEVHNWYVQSGRFIQQEDLDRNESVCVIGAQVQNDLFGKTDPIGQELKIGRQRFTVIGVMEEKGDKMATEGWDKRLIIPFTTMWTRFIGDQRRGFELWMKAENFEKVDQALAEVMVTMRRRHGSEEHFQFYTAKAVLEQVGKVSQVLKILLGGVASISLLVGGIGIMNTMLVSVTERTREIGLRKAVGAQRRDILQQFLVESVVLSVSGGLIGILISGFITFAAAWGVTTFLIKETEWPAVVSLWAAIIAFGSSALIGIIFGILPAYKAALLMPTEALRHE